MVIHEFLHAKLNPVEPSDRNSLAYNLYEQALNDLEHAFYEMEQTIQSLEERLYNKGEGQPYSDQEK